MTPRERAEDVYCIMNDDRYDAGERIAEIERHIVEHARTISDIHTRDGKGGYRDGWADGREAADEKIAAVERERDTARAEATRLARTVDRKDEQMAELQEHAQKLEAALRDCRRELKSCRDYFERENPCGVYDVDPVLRVIDAALSAPASPSPILSTTTAPLPEVSDAQPATAAAMCDPWQCQRCMAVMENDDTDNHECRPKGLSVPLSFRPAPPSPAARNERLKALGYDDVRPVGGVADDIGLKRPEDMAPSAVISSTHDPVARIKALEEQLEHHIWCATCAQDGCKKCHECSAKELLGIAGEEDDKRSI